MASAQSFTLQGSVIDAATKEPIPFATVYLNQTTLGTSTNTEGRFTLKFASRNPEIVVSVVGYKPLVYPLDVEQLEDRLYTFALEENTEFLEEVTVREKRDQAWYINLEKFKQQFLGESMFGTQCTLLNDSALVITFDPQTKILEVRAREPIIIENEQLGYRINYLLNHFQSNLGSGYVSFTGYPFFTEMEGGKGKQKRWMKNRLTAYRGSSVHFFRSLYHQRLEEEQFALRRLIRLPNPARPTSEEIKAARTAIRQRGAGSLNLDEMAEERDILRRSNYPEYVEKLDTTYVPYEDYLDASHTVPVLHFEGFFQVVFSGEKEELAFVKRHTPPFKTPREPTFQTSVISLTNEEKRTQISALGTIPDPLDILYEGYWGFEKVGDMLPLGYQPEE
jgi:hypothetical protein